MRAFFALELPTQAKAELGAWQRHQSEAWRWARPEGLHLTLAFLGEVDAPVLDRARSIAEIVAGRHAPFDLRTAELGGFPRSDRARVLWLGLDVAPALDRLAEDLRGSLRESDLPFDPKPFRAHLTLGRSERARAVDGGASPTYLAWQAGELALLASLGGSYEGLGRWPMGKR